jgi:hypothetical protein
MPNPALTLLQHIEQARALLRDLNRSCLPTDIAQVSAGLQHELGAAEGVLRDLAGDAIANLPGKVRNDAPETSRTAARRIVLRTGTQRSEILAFLSNVAVATDWEIQRALGIQPSSERPRRGELVDAGLVQVALNQDTMAVMLREHNGSGWRVWEITPAGRLAVDTIGAGQQMTFELD